MLNLFRIREEDLCGDWVIGRMCEVLVGLGEVDLVEIEVLSGDRLRVTIRSRGPRPVCEECGGGVWSEGERTVRLVDLPAFGRPVRLRWRKRRWECPELACAVKSFAEQNPEIASVRGLLTSRAGRWVTDQVAGRVARCRRWPPRWGVICIR